jgi:pyruvate formate lyase activating enzyme
MAAIVQCELCPRACEIAPGGRGDCRVRINLDGRLTALTYGFPCSLHIDPIEKKPVFHFLPGTPTLSLATVGCNLHCKNCQNWEISQRNPEEIEALELPPARLVELSRQNQCPSLSFTYTDPVIYYEYALDTCTAARAAGLRNILVTAGYINPEPAKELFRVTDVARIDLKAMSEKFYREVCDATLKPVLATIVLAREMKLLVEIVHLIVPTLNDSDADLKQLCGWVAANAGRDVPLHFSRFHPQHKLTHLPPTPVETLHRARDIARAAGLRHVYLGNVLERDAANTYCPKCNKLLLARTGFSLLENRLRDGKCPDCATEIYGIWN